MAVRIADDRSFDEIQKQQSRSVLLEHNEFLRQWNEWNESKDPRLFEKIFLANTRSAYKLAERFSFKFGIELTDAYQAACVALVNAIRKYKPETGNRLMTFAWNAMKNAIRREMEYSGSGQYKKRMRESVAAYEAALVDLRAKHGRDPTVEEIALRIGMQKKFIPMLKCAAEMKVVTSIDAPIKGQAITIGEALHAPEHSQKYASVELSARISRYVQTMKERDRMIVVHRILADVLGNETQSFEAIARMFGVSKQCIQQREEKLRKNMRRDSDYLLHG